MKLTLDTTELKKVLALVKSVADASANTRVGSHSVCLLRINSGKQEVFLDFSLNRSFLSYKFASCKVESKNPTDEIIKRNVDLSVMSSLKFSGKTLLMRLSEKNKEQVIEFATGKLKGKLLLSAPEVSEEVDKNRPLKDIPLTYGFYTREFIKGLQAHSYGQHHDAAKVAKRPVRIYSKDDKLCFASQDAVSMGFFVNGMRQLTSEKIDVMLLPAPLATVLGSLPSDTPTFELGLDKNFWKIKQGDIHVWYPNVIQHREIKLEELVSFIQKAPSYQLRVPISAFKLALEELTPFLSSGPLVSKEDTSIVTLLYTAGKARLKIDTLKAKDVTVRLDEAEFVVGGLAEEETHEILINFKFLREFTSSLSRSKEKVGKNSEDNSPDDTPLFIRWWPHQDAVSPTKGKTISLEYGECTYIVARIKKTNEEV